MIIDMYPSDDNRSIRICERELDSINSGIARITKKKSPIHNLKLILPFVTSLFFLIFPRLAGYYSTKAIEEAHARGIYMDIDQGIYNYRYISWLLADVPRLHSITLMLIILAVYCFIRLFGRYGYTRSGILPSKIAGFFGDINYKIELNKAYKEQARIWAELDELRKRKEEKDG
ncbi:MAG: hypothetical protein K5697_03845 [Lachnospiraceae bacterium]|nr:hypothetical protein [Lachnospiraceae bacterium]